MAVLSVTSQPAPQVTSAIRQAAQTTGTSFDYLIATAQLESGLNPAAQAPTSSAGGLFQSIDQTWLSIVKAVGPALGFGAYAQAIQQGADGRYQVTDPAARDAILNLRWRDLHARHHLTARADFGPHAPGYPDGRPAPKGSVENRAF